MTPTWGSPYPHRFRMSMGHPRFDGHFRIVGGDGDGVVAGGRKERGGGVEGRMGLGMGRWLGGRVEGWMGWRGGGWVEE